VVPVEGRQFADQIAADTDVEQCHVAGFGGGGHLDAAVDQQDHVSGTLSLAQQDSAGLVLTQRSQLE
jgi:hypothetical protein